MTRPSVIRIFCTALILVLLLYLGLTALLFYLQDKMIFQATREIYRTPESAGWAYEDVRLKVGEETTHGWWIPLEDARGVVLFSHGNAGNIADRIESIGLLRKLGLSVLAYDYGGYGYSTGRPSEKRCYADIRAMWRWLTDERGVQPEQIVLFGRSLGGAVTCDLAAEVEPAAVVLESTFSSVAAVAQEMFPYLPAQWLLRRKFNNLEKITHIKSPLLIIHSPDDTLIRYHHGQRLFDRATARKEFLEIRGDHNMGFVESMDTYVAGWEKFLAVVLSTATP